MLGDAQTSPRRPFVWQITLDSDSHSDQGCVTKSVRLSGFPSSPCDHTRPVDHTTPRGGPGLQAIPRWPREIRWCRARHLFSPASSPSQPSRHAGQLYLLEKKKVSRLGRLSVCSRTGFQRNPNIRPKQPCPAALCPARLNKRAKEKKCVRQHHFPTQPEGHPRGLVLFCS